MNYQKTTPCAKCPFRSDIRPYLNGPRVAEICQSLLNGASFPCHETTKFDEDGEVAPSKGEQMCAGAMIMLERMSQPNQLMRIAERIGLYDYRKLNKKAKVFKDPAAMIAANSKRKR